MLRVEPVCVSLGTDVDEKIRHRDQKIRQGNFVLELRLAVAKVAKDTDAVILHISTITGIHAAVPSAFYSTSFIH